MHSMVGTEDLLFLQDTEKQTGLDKGYMGEEKRVEDIVTIINESVEST